MTFRNEHPIAFVEFADVTAALNAMKALQGAPIGSSRIRIEFAKKKSPEAAEKRNAPAGDASASTPAEGNGEEDYAEDY